MSSACNKSTPARWEVVQFCVILPLAGGSDAVAAGECLSRCPSGLPSPLVRRDPPKGGSSWNLMGATLVLVSEFDSPLNDDSVSDSTPKGLQQLAGGRAQRYLRIAGRFIFRPWKGRSCLCCDPFRAVFAEQSFRRCRCARPPANCLNPFRITHRRRPKILNNTH